MDKYLTPRVKDLIIVIKDTLLVIDKKSSSSLKDLTEKLEKKQRYFGVEHSQLIDQEIVILNEKNNKIKKITEN